MTGSAGADARVDRGGVSRGSGALSDGCRRCQGQEDRRCEYPFVIHDTSYLDRSKK
ncbi:hypothetical protein ATSB10_22540 [Dyella thiooxydans]|uniref:Uncharacterized protein n=1 Tax=Dyella thiooxydans TaxID=445710 RepID=A0A160N2Q7_9GAMM|nr:hypothetical protein ATSB10_22540 [Dyella thiooxydans]